jgi:hypothetical protein
MISEYTTFEQWKKYFIELENDMDNFNGTHKQKMFFFKERMDKSWKMHQEVIFGRMKDLGIKLQPKNITSPDIDCN